MRQFDLAPLYRNTVGFDRLFSMLDQLVSVDSVPSYPPYNIERTGENAYRISVAVAGFTDRDLSIEVKESVLTVKGDKQASEERKSDER
jgi:molecular chaperone IbpA